MTLERRWTVQDSAELYHIPAWGSPYFGVNAKGQIRFGLGAVKGVGEGAVQALTEERAANGPFKTVFDVMRRINLRSANRKAMESLAYAGAFDSLGMERARFFLLPELFRKGETRALELADQYRGSEVEGEARKTAEACHIALTELSAGDRSDVERRLRGVLEALDPSASPHLVEHLKSALAPVSTTPRND